jgi:hypothetical protein
MAVSFQRRKINKERKYCTFTVAKTVPNSQSNPAEILMVRLYYTRGITQANKGLSD